MDPGRGHTYLDLVRRIGGVRKKSNIVAMTRGILLTSLYGGGILLLAATAEYTCRFDVSVRTVLFWTIALVLPGLVLWFVGRPALRLLHVLPDDDNAAVARQIGARLPEVRDRLENGILLYGEQSSGEYYSPDLIDASLEDLRVALAGVDLSLTIDHAETRRLSRFAGGLAAFVLLLLFLFPDPFAGSVTRLWQYNKAFASPPPFRFAVDPGNKEVIKGERVPLVVHVIGEAADKVTLSLWQEGQTVAEEKVLLQEEGQVFHFEFTALNATTHYEVRAGAVISDQYTLVVLDRPMVKMLRVRLDLPRYSGLPPKQLDDQVGDVSALKGTTLHLALESSKTLASATAMFNDGSTVSLSIDGSTASGSLLLMKEKTYHFVLQDTDGTTNADPIEYALRIVPDQYPTAAILAPGTNLDVVDNTTLAMLLKITDDYGFTKLRLGYRLSHSKYEKPSEGYTYLSLPIPAAVRTEGTISYAWSLASLRLVPEDAISYLIEVFDNDNISGPKSSVSEVYTLRIPSMDEVFADVDKAHDATLEQLQKSLQESQEAKKDLEALRQDLKTERQKMDWQDQKKAEELVKKYDEIRKKMDDVHRKVDEMVSAMQKNQVLSHETLEKYLELQQMMQQLATPEFAEAMKKIQEAMQQMNPDAMRQAMQQFSFSEENFRKSIERTMNLLKRIQIEQKVDEMLKRAEEMTKQQRDLQSKTKEIEASDPQKEALLARQESDMQQQVQEMKKELESLQKRMEELAGEMPLPEMEKTREQLDRSGLDSLLADVARQLKEQQLQQAMRGQEGVSRKMKEFQEQLGQMKQALQRNQQRQIVNEMRKALQDLLELSKRQESLKNEARNLEQNSQRFRENAQEQNEVLRDLGKVTERLSGLSQKTFSITPEMGKAIGDAMREMNGAMQSLEQRNGASAADHQTSAMASLNESSQQVEASINALMQGGGEGMGMQGFMQRLQQMSGMQQKINEQTQQMGGLSPEQAAGMSRLAGEQGMVRKSLEQLAREASRSGELSKMLGDLNSIAQDMREVQTDLAQAKPSSETLRRQERILSRLLDSQRSARERDFEKERKAESGKNTTRPGPAPLDLSTQEGKNRLRRDLLKALDAGYAKDYEELIRKYFEALEQ